MIIPLEIQMMLANNQISSNILDIIKPPPTIQEMQDGHFQLKRNRRNELLEMTDKLLIDDYPLSDSDKELVKIYRQNLRDYFTRQDVIDWVFSFENQHPPNFPEVPECIKKRINIPTA